MTTDAQSPSVPLPPSLSWAQIDLIARQEGADADIVTEAVRRMNRNPRLQQGKVRSPAAFFRGIVRGALADQAASPLRPLPPQHQLTPFLPTSSSDLPQSPTALDRTPGHMALRAHSLFSAGTDEHIVRRLLHTEFPSAPADLVAWAITNGLALHRALSH
ncbi:MAG: hypothetical protein ACYCS1_11815 [Gammaproteobacteria bacterium]